MVTTVCTSRLSPMIMMSRLRRTAQHRSDQSAVRRAASNQYLPLLCLPPGTRRIQLAEDSRARHRYQFVDHVAYTRGNHAIKFGGEIHHDAFNGGAYGGARGRIKFVGGSAWATGTDLQAWKIFSPACQPRQASWSEIRRDTSTIGGMPASFRMTGGSPKP